MDVTTVDTNIILRIILKDNPDMEKEVINFIKINDILIRNEVLAEVIYVLSKSYNISRQDVYVYVMKILKLKRARTESNDVILLALETFKDKSLDFVDCLLYAYNKISGCEIYTFDKKLNKLLNKTEEYI